MHDISNMYTQGNKYRPTIDGNIKKMYVLNHMINFVLYEIFISKLACYLDEMVTYLV